MIPGRLKLCRRPCNTESSDPGLKDSAYLCWAHTNPVHPIVCVFLICDRLWRCHVYYAMSTVPAVHKAAVLAPGNAIKVCKAHKASVGQDRWQQQAGDEYVPCTVSQL